MFAAALCATFLVPAVVRLAVEPDAFGWAVAANGALGWSAAVLAGASAAWGSWRRGASQSAVAVFVAALVALVALTAAHWDNGNWLAYHTLLAGTCMAAWLLPLVARAVDQLLAGTSTLRAPIWSAPAARFFAVVAVVLAVRAYDGDPASPWWTRRRLGDHRCPQCLDRLARATGRIRVDRSAAHHPGGQHLVARLGETVLARRGDSAS